MTDPSKPVHIIVEAGPDKGRDLTIPPGGARVGRSGSNDIALNDPSLSRFHCRFYFKPDGSLHCADLASTNETLVNDRPIQDVALVNGDRVTIGETVMKVLCQTLVPPSGARPPSPPARKGPDIDLGLKGDEPAPSPRPRSAGSKRLSVLLWILLLMVAAFAVYFVLQMRGGGAVPAASATALRSLELDYEKVQASSTNLFYYALTLRDGTVAVQLINLRDGRTVNREKKVDSTRIDQVARSLEEAGFFQLNSEYVGQSPDVWDAFDLTVTVGAQTRRVRVVNRTEPDSFRDTRLRIEEFGQNELGLTALALPPDRLRDLARDAWQAGMNFFNQREVRNDNLARAIRSFTEVDMYLETVEPKPDFYGDALARKADAVQMLNEKYEEYLFRADKAIRLRDWDEANRHLRVILDMLPDRDDKRYRDTDRKLMDVQSRMSRR